MSHTPGPWHVGNQTDNGRAIIRDEAGCRIAIIESTGSKEMDEANARLIAKAPALFKSLQAMIDVADVDEVHDHDMGGCDDCVLCDARKALSLATPA